jgi:hypothetical protein
VNPNQLVEGNALKGFNEECDNYYFASPDGEEGIASVQTQLASDDSETIGDAVVNWLNKVGAKQAFMATIWFHTPHQNFAATDRWLDLYNHTNYTSLEKLYYADLSGMDHQIGRIRQTLIDLNLQDTALWFTADNGPEHSTPGSNGGLTGRKRDITEGGIRNPGLLEWPARINANYKTEYAAKIVDYLPTLMDALGYDKIDQVRQRTNKGWPLDGVSLLPVIKAIASGAGTGTILHTGREKPLGWVSQHAQGGAHPKSSHASSQMAWMVGDMKLYRNRSADAVDFDRASGTTVIGTETALATAASSENRSGSGGFSANFTTYLFNISSDPTESTDLSSDAIYQDILVSMTSGLQGWIKTVQQSRTSAETNCDSWDPQFPKARSN